MKYYGCFSPVPDCIVDELGTTAGLVFGAVWRFCQMDPKNICDAPHSEIAEWSGVPVAQVIPAIAELVAHGWLRRMSEKGKKPLLRDTKRWCMYDFTGEGDDE